MKLRRFLSVVITILSIWGIGCLEGYGDETGEYLIKVNRVQNCVTIFQKDGNGEFSIPYKAMTCSTGLNADSTPLGTFSISQKQEWGELVDGSYGQYCSRVVDSIMIHSVPYTGQEKNSLKTEEYNKLGQAASLGCIRMRAVDAKWIYDNCPEGTQVIIYDDDISPGSLGKPDSTPIPPEHEYAGWDPTDEDESNPWRNLSPAINGVNDIEITVGDNVDLYENVTAADICGNDVSDLVKINGEYDTDKAGVYSLEYEVTDGFGHNAKKDFTLKVNKNPEETAAAQMETATEYRKEEKMPKTGVGPIMTILFIGVCTFIVSSLIVRHYRNS